MERVKRFAIVGAGVGGLATALRLAHRGHEVTVFEKTDQVGGRNREVTVGGSRFDAGPTLLMMLDPLQKLFADVGEDLDEHLTLVRCDPNYRIRFADGVQLDCTTDVDMMASRLAALSGPRAAEAYRRMLHDLGELYRTSIPQFVRRNYRSPIELLHPRRVAIALKHGMLGNLAKGIGRYFDDPRLQMLFTLQAMYLGLSPYDAPFVYAVLTYMEYGEGIWYPMGGLVEISSVLARLAEGRGAEIRLDAPVCRIEDRTVVLESGERKEFDAVIVNADLPYAERALLLSVPKPRRRYSCSAFMMYIDYEGQVPELLHHNIVLGADFQRNLDQLFRSFQIPDDPAFYVAVSSKTDPSRAEPGHENLMILVPCPNLTHSFDDQDAATLRDTVFERLEKETAFRRERIARMHTLDPRGWLADLNLDRGAAFGLSHDLFQSVCFRPSNKAHGVYFVGASTHPGNGLPMVLISAELVEQRLQDDGLLP